MRIIKEKDLENLETIDKHNLANILLKKSRTRKWVKLFFL